MKNKKSVFVFDFKRTVSFSIFLLIFSAALAAQSYNIDYYGIVSTEIDANMSKMTSDLYYTQLSEINNFSVEDKRTTPSLSDRPDSSEFSDGRLSFFTLITKEAKSDKWITTYFVVDKSKNEAASPSPSRTPPAPSPFGVSATTSSTIVFQAPHPGHFPSHCTVSYPHCWQTYRVFFFANAFPPFFAVTPIKIPISHENHDILYEDNTQDNTHVETPTATAA